MSLFDGKPIGRIDLSPRRPNNPNVEPIDPVDVDKCERYWRAVRATAEGTNISTPTEDSLK